MGPRVSSLLAGALVAAGAASASAEPKPEEPSARPPSLELSVRERGPGRPWSVSIENLGSEAATLAADPRLLWFEVAVPGQKKKAVCRLPSELFPQKRDPRTVVALDPGEGVAESFDPRLYCFAAGGQWQLVPGAIVTPHFGWPEKTKTVWKGGKKVEQPAKQEPPFVASAAPGKGESVDDDDPGVKELVGKPFALKSDYAEWSRTRLPADKKAAENSPLSFSVLQGSDARAESSATVTLKLENRSKHKVTVYFRRELVSFEVMRPDGLVTCDPQPDQRAPDRQAFATLGPGGSIGVTSRLIELCPSGTFAQPGLYLVHARFDATEAGDDYGLDAFVGRVVSKNPATVRIRTGAQSFLHKRRMRPVQVGDSGK